MKKILFILFALFLTYSFAADYTISAFSATDAGSPDSYIEAEFGGELKTASPTAVLDIQAGRIFVRQKFEDPFEEEETSYQIYQGRSANTEFLSPFQAPSGVSYHKILNFKIYTSSDADPEDDVEKVYFDGKSIYLDGASTAYIYSNGTMVKLLPKDADKNEPALSPIPAPASPVQTAYSGTDDDDDEYCDEYDDDCDDEEESFQPTPAPAAPVQTSYSDTDEDDDEYCDEDDEDCDDDEYCDEDDEDCDDDEYEVVSNDYSNADQMSLAASTAASDVKDRFGIADEVRFWTGVAFSAAAAVTAGLGIWQHLEANKIREETDKLSDNKSNIDGYINEKCAKQPNVAQCKVAVENQLEEKHGTLADLTQRIDLNNTTMKSYTNARNIFFIATGVSLGVAITLFVW